MKPGEQREPWAQRLGALCCPAGGGDLLCRRVPKATAPLPRTPAPRAGGSRAVGAPSAPSRRDPVRRTRQEGASL